VDLCERYFGKINKLNPKTWTVFITLKTGQMKHINIKFAFFADKLLGLSAGSSMSNEKSPGKISNWSFVWEGFHLPFLTTRNLFWNSCGHRFSAYMCVLDNVVFYTSNVAINTFSIYD
jgi:hypothetical protein